MMFHKLSFYALLIATLLLATGVQAELSFTEPERAANGDYITNIGPVQAKEDLVRAGATWQPGSLWRVRTPWLNCRREPDPNSAVVRGFRKGALIQAEVGGGGSDEVMYNVKDKRGHTWMHARSLRGNNLNCFVRAHQRFIEPVRMPIKR